LNKTAKTGYNYELAKTNLIYTGTNFKNNNSRNSVLNYGLDKHNINQAVAYS